MIRRVLSVVAAAAALMLAAAASDPSERLPDPAQEARARELFREIRCVVCQNESIDDSEADLARDLRTAVREQVAAGRSDAEVRDFMVERYGEFVLLKPALSAGNALLWLAPFLIVLFAAAGFALHVRRRPSEASDLSPQEEAKLAALLDPGAAATVSPRRRPKKVSPRDRSLT
jgi:cytochrome c-type biogenesis protein CcmH